MFHDWGKACCLELQCDRVMIILVVAIESFGFGALGLRVLVCYPELAQRFSDIIHSQKVSIILRTTHILVEYDWVGDVQRSGKGLNNSLRMRKTPPKRGGGC